MSLLSLEEIQRAREVVSGSSLGVRRTPCLLVRDSGEGEACTILPDLQDMGWSRVFLKLENLQATGSFKIRGVANQFERARDSLEAEGGRLVTMSAGNYGRSYAVAAKSLGLEATVLLPSTAPQSREELLKDMGVSVERLPSSELLEGVKRHEAGGATFLHPFDCRDLIAGHASMGLEILEQVPDVDTVLICCGGGGCLAGVATAVKLLRPQALVYGVEPETANTMHQSLLQGHPVTDPKAKSCAAGLAPPFAGTTAYQHVSQYCEGIILVSEAELKQTSLACHRDGLVVEPSGAAALAAFMAGKVKCRGEGGSVVIVLTGGNISPREMEDLEK